MCLCANVPCWVYAKCPSSLGGDCGEHISVLVCVVSLWEGCHYLSFVLSLQINIPLWWGHFRDSYMKNVRPPCEETVASISLSSCVLFGFSCPCEVKSISFCERVFELICLALRSLAFCSILSWFLNVVWAALALARR